MIPETLRTVDVNRIESELGKDVERYCLLAREKGASAAAPVSASDILVDERVALKCSIPKCFGYNTSANCPPHSMKPDETRKILSRFRMGVVFKLDVPPGVIVRDKSTILERVESYRKVSDLVNSIESAAFYDGYYLAAGFAAGSCKSTYCHDKPCAVLGGEKCRLSLRSRPSMEAVGIDCYRLARILGWDIYPIGSDVKSPCVPSGTLMGCVLVD